MSEVFLRVSRTQKITVAASSAAITNAFADGITKIRVISTTACYIAFGTAPTATTNDIYVPAGVPLYFKVSPGDKVAAIQASAGGTCHVDELTL